MSADAREVVSGEREAWLPVVGFEGRYEVSDVGRIRIARSGRALAQHVNSNGYKQCSLTRDSGKRSTLKVHVLVAGAFIGPRPPGFDAHHGDGNKANNDARNLSWVTRSENVKHACQTGLQRNRGEFNSQSRLNTEVVKVLRHYRGRRLLRVLAGLHGVEIGTVWKAQQGRTWEPTS